MKHFIAFVTLGIAAIGSGMVLANHFSMPEPQPVALYPSVTDETPSSPLTDVSLSSLPAMPRSLPEMPRSLPDPQDAVNGAGRAFGKATDTVEYYSDKAFGSTARKVKQTVDQAKVPTVG